MRKITYVSTFLFIFSVAQASAKVWVVNANGTGNFTTLTAAIDSAASGDTLFVAPGGYVESPSATSKTLTVLGIGFSSDSATTWSIILNSPLALGAGSVVSGLELRGIANPAMINVNSPNTVVEKCHIAANGHDGIDVAADSCVVRQNVFENILPTTANGVTVTGSHLGITILNNAISNFNNGIMLNNGGDEIVANNAIFFAYNAAVSFGSGTFAGKIFSNIFDEDNLAIAATSPPYYCGYNDYWQDPYGGTPSFDVGSISVTRSLSIIQAPLVMFTVPRTFIWPLVLPALMPESSMSETTTATARGTIWGFMAVRECLMILAHLSILASSPLSFLLMQPRSTGQSLSKYLGG